MVTINDWLASIRTALNANTTLSAIMTGGWLFERQVSAATEAYGVLMLDFDRQERTSGCIFRWYTLTAVAYASVTVTTSSAAAITIPTQLAITLDNQGNGGNVTAPTGGGIVLITPKSLDQKLADKMKSGYDVTPLMSQWTMQVAESRA